MVVIPLRYEGFVKMTNGSQPILRYLLVKYPIVLQCVIEDGGEDSHQAGGHSDEDNLAKDFSADLIRQSLAGRSLDTVKCFC